MAELKVDSKASREIDWKSFQLPHILWMVGPLQAKWQWIDRMLPAFPTDARVMLCGFDNASAEHKRVQTKLGTSHKERAEWHMIPEREEDTQASHELDAKLERETILRMDDLWQAQETKDATPLVLVLMDLKQFSVLAQSRLLRAIFCRCKHRRTHVVVATEHLLDLKLPLCDCVDQIWCLPQAADARMNWPSLFNQWQRRIGGEFTRQELQALWSAHVHRDRFLMVDGNARNPDDAYWSSTVHALESAWKKQEDDNTDLKKPSEEGSAIDVALPVASSKDLRE